jgi:hypothetical protein
MDRGGGRETQEEKTDDTLSLTHQLRGAFAGTGGKGSSPAKKDWQGGRLAMSKARPNSFLVQQRWNAATETACGVGLAIQDANRDNVYDAHAVREATKQWPSD